MADSTVRISKFLSLVLRHKPKTIGIELDEAGWLDVEMLLSALKAHPAGREIDRATLNQVVAENDKQRFEFSEDGQRIRARQGHSVDVELGYEVATPPRILFHGTPAQFVDSIRVDGLKKMKRHHVHLHQDESLARDVGSRRGKPVLLQVRAGEMHAAGHPFFQSSNNVWLTDRVPPEFIDFLCDEHLGNGTVPK